MESKDVAGVLQETGDADSRALIKLNISSFLTIPHPSDYLIDTNDIMVIVLLLQMMEGWEGWEGGGGAVVYLC